MHSKNQSLGAISFLGSYVLLLYFAFELGALSDTIDGIYMLLSGSVDGIVSGQIAFIEMIPVIIAVIALTIPCSILAGVVSKAMLGKTTNHSVVNMLAEMKEGNHFLNFFVIVVAEELVARWFFLGLLTMIPFLSGTFAFYALFLLGNSLWALVHLANYKNPKDRHWLRVLPQFVGGIFFTYLFVKFGLVAAILGHFASNAILFSLHKIQRVNWVDYMLILYYAILAVVSYLLMDQPVSDMMVWLSDQPTFILDGWDFWDYLLASIFIPAVFGLASSLLLYDRGEVNAEKKEPPLYAYFIAAPIMLGILFGLYALLGFVVDSVPYRILAVAIALVFAQRSASASASSRSFWVDIPTLYLTVCVVFALGWQLSIVWFALRFVVSIPGQILIKYDD